MPDVRRFLRGAHALLRRVEDRIEAKARLFLTLLVEDFFIGIRCRRFPLFPVSRQRFFRHAVRDELIFIRVDVLEPAAMVQNVIRCPDRVVCRFFDIGFLERVPYIDGLSPLPPVDGWDAARKLICRQDTKRDKHLVWAAIYALRIRGHDCPLCECLIARRRWALRQGDANIVLSRLQILDRKRPTYSICRRHSHAVGVTDVFLTVEVMPRIFFPFAVFQNEFDCRTVISA